MDKSESTTGSSSGDKSLGEKTSNLYEKLNYKICKMKKSLIAFWAFSMRFSFLKVLLIKYIVLKCIEN